jgi:hypothetical protein
MTQFFPSPTPPGSWTVLQAMGQGLLPAQTELANYGNTSVANALSNGQITPATLCSALVFSAPNANYIGA